MNKRKISFSGLGAPFKKPRQRAGAALYNTFARAGAFARPAAHRRTGPRGMVNTEVKGCDVLLTQASIITTTNTNANVVLLNGIQQGTGSFNRVGRKLLMKTLRLRGTAVYTSTPSATGVVNGNVMRMVVVYDKQPSAGSIPTWDTIFGITDQQAGETSTVMAPLRYDNMDRFQVLRDKLYEFDVDPAGVVSTGTITQQVVIDEFVTINKSVVYATSSNPSTLADISSGGLYVYFRALTQDATSNVTVPATAFARLRYTD